LGPVFWPENYLGRLKITSRLLSLINHGVNVPQRKQLLMKCVPLESATAACLGVTNRSAVSISAVVFLLMSAG
jgi:hypothetical protein